MTAPQPTHESEVNDLAPNPSLTGGTNVGDGPTRFGIGEWYGYSFTELSVEKRKLFSSYQLEGSSCLKAGERTRLVELRAKADRGDSLTQKESDRKAALESKFEIERESVQLCPFKKLAGYGSIPCTKSGGVCSIRAYEQSADGTVKPASGARGVPRTLCPNRFHEDDLAFRWASNEILNQPNPVLVGEVGFLESSDTYDGSEGEDVGRIDMVVVDNEKPIDYPLPWLALEIQAVYFSGPEMGKLFRQVAKDIEAGGTGLVYPTENRRPDYRSSGPKRLMPQLQIKVPTLRRWGKKMAIVVDRPFYESMGVMQKVEHVSLSDVAWFIVDFKEDKNTGRFQLIQGEAHFMTLEEAVKGLTGGTPVAQPDFEQKIRVKLPSNP